MITPFTVGFIGLGKMGSAIAHRIQAADIKLVVYNRTPAKTEPFVKLGATIANTPREAAAAADIVITSLMDDASVLNAVLGPDGILAGMRPQGIHVGATTISPKATTELARIHRSQDTEYVAAPVLGRPEAVVAGNLRTLVAGDPTAIERCIPVLRAYTAEQIRVGTEQAAAASMKLVANFLIVSLIELMGQAFVFGEKRGIDKAAVKQLLDFVLPGPLIKAYGERIRDRQFDNAGFTLTAGLKDVQLMLDAAGEVQAPLPYASLIRGQMLSAMAHGLQDHDWSVLTEALRSE